MASAIEEFIVVAPATLGLEEEIEEFIQERRARTNRGNQEEFVNVSDGHPETSSRTAPSHLNREDHMKTAVIDNQDIILNRSIVVESSKPKVFNAAEERIKNLETHLGIMTAACDKNLYERIKIVEDKILKIEQLYPQIAAHCFNYGRAEKEASLRPGGRVSKMVEKESKTEKKRVLEPSSAQEIQMKLLKLREKISTNKK